MLWEEVFLNQENMNMFTYTEEQNSGEREGKEIIDGA